MPAAVLKTAMLINRETTFFHFPSHPTQLRIFGHPQSSSSNTKCTKIKHAKQNVPASAPNRLGWGVRVRNVTSARNNPFSKPARLCKEVGGIMLKQPQYEQEQQKKRSEKRRAEKKKKSCVMRENRSNLQQQQAQAAAHNASSSKS